MREVFRLFSLTETYEIWIIPEKEVQFYNLVFAFISIIFGQSLCFSVWFDKPKKLFQNLHRRNTTIVNSQRAINSYFLHWFSKIVIVCFVFFGTTISGGYSYLDFYPNYIWVFILLIIFLFFQSWNQILIQFKRKSFVWFIISVFVVVSMSFGLSRINIINYHKINEIAKSKNIIGKYELELPLSQNYSRLEKKSLAQQIYIVNEKENSKENQNIIIYDNKTVSFQELNVIITDWISQLNECELPFTTLCYHIDKNTKIEFYHELIENARNCKILRLSFAVCPKPTFKENKNDLFVFSINIPNSKAFESEQLQILQESIDSISNKIDITISSENIFDINGTSTTANELENQIYKLILKENDYLIRIFCKETDNFESYFAIFDASKTAINKLRNEYSLRIYKMEYEELDENKMFEVRNLFPWRVLDMSGFLKKSRQ